MDCIAIASFIHTHTRQYTSPAATDIESVSSIGL